MNKLKLSLITALLFSGTPQINSNPALLQTLKVAIPSIAASTTVGYIANLSHDISTKQDDLHYDYLTHANDTGYAMSKMFFISLTAAFTYMAALDYLTSKPVNNVKADEKNSEQAQNEISTEIK